MVKKVINKKLGELLMERGILTKEKLAHALEIQEEKGGLIGEIIVKLGYAKEEDIAQALTEQYGFPFLPLENYELDPDIVKIIPKNVAYQYCLIAIDHIGKTLTVAMSNPLNEHAIEDIELISGLNVQIFVSTHSQVMSAIGKYYK